MYKHRLRIAVTSGVATILQWEGLEMTSHLTISKSEIIYVSPRQKRACNTHTKKKEHTIGELFATGRLRKIFRSSIQAATLDLE